MTRNPAIRFVVGALAVSAGSAAAAWATFRPGPSADLAWGAVVDSDATSLSLLCLDATTHQHNPERGRLVLQRTELNWHA